MKNNQGDFGSISLEGESFFFRFRSFVSLKTGEVLDKRTTQKSLLGTRDGSIYKDLNSSALHIKAQELRERIISAEQSALAGQAAGDSTAAPPVAPDGGISIAKFFETVFLPAKKRLMESGKRGKGGCSPITYETYQRYWNAEGYGLKHHFTPVLTFKTYKAWMGRRFLEGLAKSDGSAYGENTVNKIHSIAQAIFTLAVEDGYAESNPWHNIKRAKVAAVPAEQGIAYTEDEVKAILRHLDEERGLSTVRDTNIQHAKLAINLCFYAGLRPSEATALQWQNVNFSERTITVAERVVEGNHGRGTKKGENRTITFLDPLLPVLREYHKQQGSPKSGLVLRAEDGTEDGGYVDLNGLGEAKGIIARTCKKHGLRWEGLYGCRRGGATLLVELGASPLQVATFLGNTVAVAEKHYFKTNKLSAQAADIYRQRKLEQAQAAEGRLSEEDKDVLASMGIAEEVQQ